MNTTNVLKAVVGATVAAFAYLLGTIYLFGLTYTLAEKSLDYFKTVYFVFTVVLLGFIYLYYFASLTSKTDKILMALALVIFSAGIATFVGGLKGAHDAELYISGSEPLDQAIAQNEYYVKFSRQLSENLQAISANNRLLLADAQNLDRKLNNRTPIIVETVKVIPGQIIYEEEEYEVPYEGVYPEEYEEEEEDD